MIIKDKKAFITVYVLITMIFLITIITISIIVVSGKIKDQTQLNSELYKLYNKEKMSDIIIENLTEIPIYTKEQFEYLRDWIKNSNRKTEYMLINERLYKLDAQNYSAYKATLRTDLKFDYKGRILGIDVIKNDFNIIIEDEFYVAYVYDDSNGWSRKITSEEIPPEGRVTAKFYLNFEDKITEQNILKFDVSGNFVELPIEPNNYSYKLVIDGIGEMPSFIDGSTGGYLGYQEGINNLFKGGTVKDNLFMPYVKKVIISEGITSIGEGAFLGAKHLTNMSQIEIPTSVTKISTLGMAVTGLEEIEIPDNINQINNLAFQCSFSLKKVKIPSTVKIIGAYAFQFCEALENLNISEGVEKIEESAFFGCKNLKILILPSTIKKVQYDAFYSCASLKEMYINIDISSDIQKINEIFHQNAFDSIATNATVEDPLKVYVKGNVSEQEVESLFSIEVDRIKIIINNWTLPEI